MNAPILTGENVTARLGAREALARVSFRLDQPGLVVLAGPNGAGKTTLLRLMAGLRRPEHGRLIIDGDIVADMPAAARARAIAYMPQERGVHWDVPARTLVDLGRLPHRHDAAAPSSADAAAVERALAEVDATHLAARPVLSLSGGERARILMARALAQEARVLLADEPAAGLDPAHQWALFETLTRIAARGVRVVVVMHDLALMSRFAASVLLLHDGRLAAAGTPADVFTPAQLAEVYGITAATLDGMLVPTGRRG